MKILGKETLREKLLEEKVKELEEIISSKEEKEKKEKHREALIYLKGVCDEYKREQTRQDFLKKDEVIDYDIRIRV